MAASNYDSVLDQLREAGLILDGPLEFGRWARCRVEGERGKKGWYRLNEIHTQAGDWLIVGAYGVNRGADHGTQKIRIDKVELAPAEREAIRKRLAEDRRRAERERKAAAERAAQRAQAAWAKCSEVGESEYLRRKGVGAHGVRFSPSGALVIPVSDAAGKIHGLEVIRSGEHAKHHLAKEFWPAGLAKKAHFHLVGTPTSIVLLAEGYATFASVHEAMMLPAACAFDATNLPEAAEAIHKRYPHAKILLCADNDNLQKCHECGARIDVDAHPSECPKCGKLHHAANAGVAMASTAALAVGGAYVVPVFPDEAARVAAFIERGTKVTDFNDLHHDPHGGLAMVRAQLEARITDLGWRSGSAAPAVPTENGGRGGNLTPIASVEELLRRFALVFAKGGLVFDRQEHLLLALTDVGHACANRGIYRTWSEDPRRSIVREREVGFDPGGEDPDVTCNLWSGWPTTPVAGNCEVLLDLLKFLCSYEGEGWHQLYDWVLRWCAYPIQHPGAKMKTAIVMHGPPGAGKNTFFEAVMSIYGPYGQVVDQPAVDDKFTDWAERKLFILADEVVASKELYSTKNRLKSMITGDWIRINPKTLPAHNERNHVNIVFLSNEERPLIVEKGDRRYAVFWTPNKYAELPSGGFADDAFYARAIAARHDPAVIAALHDYLLNVDLGEFTSGTLPPKTRAKDDLILISGDSPTTFWYALRDGDIPELPFCCALTTDLYDAYRVWCVRTGERSIPMPRFANQLVKRHEVTRYRTRYVDVDGDVHGPHGILMQGDRQMTDGQDERAWLGQQIFQFRGAVKDYKGGVSFG